MGVPMSHVDYKKWQCRPVEFKETTCHPVDLKKTSCHYVGFRKVPCRMSLMPEKSHVAMSILGVYAPIYIENIAQGPGPPQAEGFREGGGLSVHAKSSN